jgi:cytosine permease
LSLAFVGAVGIGWLGWLSSWLPIFPLLMIVVAGFSNREGLSKFGEVTIVPPGLAGISVLGLAAFMALQTTAGFFATAGAAGADFAMNSRNRKDVVMGGFVGITLAALVVGVFALMTIAGAMGKNPAIAEMGASDQFGASLKEVGGVISKVMFWVFVVASICPTGFCAFLAANSFSTMFPKLPRVGLTLVAGAIGVSLAATGVANNLIGFFLIIGASFGPIIGAMTADYLRSGKWAGPRKGINWAGYIAWGVGFAVGILGVIPRIGFSYGLETLMSFLVGLAVYLILAEMGLEPPTIELSSSQ